ncbi:hypothetical protein ACET3Z_015343 [Daucus carota]
MNEMNPNPANSSPFTPLSFLERAAVVYGDTPSLIYNQTTYTWSQTHRRCLQLASSISSLSISPGDVVSVLAPNIPAMYELHFAVPMSGAVLNCINTRLDARTISILLKHSESKLLFVDYQIAPVALEAVSHIPRESRPILAVITEGNEDQSPLSRSFDYVYESLVEKGDPMFNWIRPRSDWDPMVLNYTSGTTASPKGVVHSHRGLFIMSVDGLVEWSVPKQPVYLWTLPMFHANGWCFTWGMAAVGATNICLRKFDSDLIFTSIIEHGVTHMCGAPVVLNMLSNNSQGVKLEKPVHILTAGAPPPAAVLMRTEKLGFVDRSKDVIISGGENLSSVEVESVLYLHPAVNEAAVVARPDEFWGETPCAFVSLNAGMRANENEIIKFCREKLPKYMVPKNVVFKEELPKTSTGKIQKFLLRDMAKELGRSKM